MREKFLVSIIIGLIIGAGVTIYFATEILHVEKEIAIIELKGDLITGKESPFGTSTGELQRSLEKALRDDEVKAVVLKVDSPGGTATASYEIYSMVKRFEKPIVAFGRGVMASGSYLASLGADKVVAHPFSMVGSVGVYIQLRKPVPVEPENAEEITVIPSGKFKTLWEDDILDENEREFLRDKAEETENTFFNIVYEEAPIERPENVEENIENPIYVLTEGGWFNGEQAFELGLFDELGDFENAINIASELAGIKREEATIIEIEPPEPETFEDMFYESRLHRDNEKPVVFLK